MPHITMVGNMQPYPNLKRAGPRNVRRAQRLKRRSLATAARFDTFAEARALGYVIGSAHLPGFVHARKFGYGFWGKLLDPDAPQALVYWCPKSRHCTLTTYMFRAPAGRPPSTWRKLLQWHRHGDRSTSWMTHVWLVPKTRQAFATCAPWAALSMKYGIKQPRHYNHHVNDEPCPDDNSMSMDHHQ
jgi:hypothetical protein